MKRGTIITIATIDEIPLLERVAEYLEYRRYPVLITGVGALNVANALSGMSRDTEIINVGYAGSANISIGSIVQISHVGIHHPGCRFQDRMFQLQENGIPCYSSCDFVTESSMKDCVYDMELAFICAMGFKVRSVKVVSDNLCYTEYEQTIDSNGKE